MELFVFFLVVFFVLLVVSVILLSIFLMHSKANARNFAKNLLEQNKITNSEYSAFLGENPLFIQAQSQSSTPPQRQYSAPAAQPMGAQPEVWMRSSNGWLRVLPGWAYRADGSWGQLPSQPMPHPVQVFVAQKSSPQAQQPTAQRAVQQRPLAQPHYPPPVRPAAAMPQQPLYPVGAPLIPRPLQRSKEAKRMIAVNLVLSLGVVFILLAGFIFATTTWQSLGGGVRLLLLVAQTCLFFGVSVIAEKRFKLHNTGKAFYILGCLFCMVSMAGIGYFRLLGEWFSFYGGGTNLLIAIAVSLFGATSFIGLKRYKNALFLWAASISSEIAAAFFLRQFLPGQLVAFGVLAGACLLTWFVCVHPYVRLKTDELQRHLLRFVSLNFWVAGASCLAFVVFENTLPALLVEIALLVTLSALCIKKTIRAGWNFHPPLLLCMFSTVAGLLPLEQSLRYFVVALLCVAALWGFRILSAHTPLQIQRHTSDILFPLALFILALLGWETPPGMWIAVLLSAAVFSLALEKQDSDTAKVFAWFAAFMPALLWIEFAALRSGQPSVLQMYEKTRLVLLFYAVLALVFSVALGSMVFFKNHRMRRFQIPFAVGVLCNIPVAFVVRFLLVETMQTALYLPVAAMLLGVGLCGTAMLLLRKNAGKWMGIASWGRGIPAAICGCLLAFWAVGTSLGILVPAHSDGLLRLYLLAGSAVLFLWLCVARRFLSHPEGALSKTVGWMWLGISQGMILLCGVRLFPGGDEPFAYCAALVLLLGAGYFALHLRRQSIWGGLFPLLALPVLLLNAGTLPGWQTWHISLLALGGFVVYALLGRLLYREIWQPQGDKTPPMLDYFTIFALSSPLFLFAQNQPLYQFVGFLSLATWFLLFVKRIALKNADLWAISAALAAAFCAVWVQPFIALPALLKTEVNICLWLAYFLLIRFVVWRGRATIFNWVLLSATVLAILRQGVDVVWVENVPDGIFMAVLSLSLLCIYAYSRNKTNQFTVAFEDAFKWTALMASQGSALVLAASFWLREGYPLWYGVLLCCLLVAQGVLLYWQKLALYTPLLTLLLMPFMHTFSGRLGLSHNEYFYGDLLLFGVFCLLGRILYKQVFVRAIQPPQKLQGIDYFTLFAVIIPLYWVVAGDAYRCFFGILLLGMWCLLFWGKIPYNNADRCLATAAIALCMVAFWIQPFVVWPALFSTEIALIPVILFALALRHVVWKAHPLVTGWVLFGIATLCIALQGWDALRFSYLWDALLLGVGALGLLLFACIVCRRRWFLLAVGTLAALVLYKSSSFWVSLAWWVYLLFAGLLLIALAAANEGYRQKGSHLGKRMLSLQFFTKWDW